MPSDAKIAAHAHLALESFLPYRLSVLSNRISGAIARRYSEKFGLTVAEWRVMAVIGGAPGLSAREVSERTAMDKVQVSRTVANLVLQKLVQRKSHEADGRMTRLRLTARGQDIYDEIAPMAKALEDAFLSALSPKERETLDTLIGKLTAQAEQIDKSATI